MWHNGRVRTVVAHGDDVGGGVDSDVQLVHALVALLVIRRVHQNLVEDLVQPGRVCNGAVLYGLAVRTQHVHVARVPLDGTDCTGRKRTP